MTEKSFTMWNSYFRTVKTLIKSFLQASGSAFAIFCPIFYYCNISISHRVMSLLSLPQYKEKSKCKERPCGNCCWNQRGTACLFYCSPARAPDPPQMPRQWRVHTLTLCIWLPKNPYRYTLSYTSDLSFNNSERAPTKIRLIWVLLLITMGTFFSFLLAGSLDIVLSQATLVVTLLLIP